MTAEISVQQRVKKVVGVAAIANGHCHCRTAYHTRTALRQTDKGAALRSRTTAVEPAARQRFVKQRRVQPGNRHSGKSTATGR